MRHATSTMILVMLMLAGCAAPAVEADGGDSATPDAGATIDTGAAPDGNPEDVASDPASDAAGPPLVRSTDFAEAAGDVRNPDRGFYWWDWNEDAALVLVKVYLGDQCDTPTLPASVLTDLRARLGAHRAGGRRAILRFNYADDGVLNRCGLADAESLGIVLGHVSQLASIFAEHEDVIAFVEAGFFGMWGEWNQELAPAGTSLSAVESNRDELLLALLAAVPASRTVETRRPRFREELGGTPAELARVGLHNDCFLASADDWGTYDGARSIASWKAYVREATLVVPLGGETCNDDPTYTSCVAALAEMETLRFTYLHEGYLAAVIDRWRSEGCLDEIRRRLGYRMVVRAVEAPVSLAPGDPLTVRVELENVGFAPPSATRRLQVRLADAAGVVVDLGAPSTLDARSWAPGATHAIVVGETLPMDLLPGTYEVRLALLEDASDLPAYAMVFANDVRVRDDVRRENIVASIIVAE